MGSFRRPRPRFMSSPVLSDLARFHANSPSMHRSNASVWNSVQTAVVRVFEGGGLQPNELYTLNESIRWLLKTELGSFITDYLQRRLSILFGVSGHSAGLTARNHVTERGELGNFLTTPTGLLLLETGSCPVNKMNQLLTKGLSHILERIQLYEGERQLLILSEMWIRFFTETLPTLQAIFYPVQGQELTVRQMCLLAFRDLVILKLPLQDNLRTSGCIPPAITQMLLILQGVHDNSAEYFQLERLVEMVISPYLGKVLHNSTLLLESHLSGASLRDRSRPEICVTQHHHASTTSDYSLAPLVEQDGEAYLEKSGGVRRHTVANAHSDIQLLSASGRMMHAGMAEEDSGGGGGGAGDEGGGGMAERPYYSQPDILEVPRCRPVGGSCQAAELG